MMNYRAIAQATLASAKINKGQHFDALTDDQRAAIQKEAELVYRVKYGKPMPAAFVRKRYELLQKRAKG
ncbi:hypothetical protein [Bradyrhizobium sp. LB5.2]|jgi:hypothetical protein|uniref:hypothetical protein n=1 Tax=Bradyrhizobium sp. LB5.2 TaxID=3156329 RepID=UPI0033943008